MSTMTQPIRQQKSSYASAIPFEIRPLSDLQEYHTRKNEIPGLLDAFKIVWITRGKGRCWIDMRHFELADNDLVCIQPGKVARLDPLGCPEGYLISFTEDFLSMEEQEFDLNYQRGLSRIFSHSPMIPVMNEIKEEMVGIAERMKKEFDNLFLYKNQILRRYLKIFLLYLSRHGKDTIEDAGNSRGMELAHEFMTLLDKDFKLVRSVTEYARQLSVTPNHLNVVVKKNTGHTAGHHVKQRLILEAKRLAVYSNLCMKEIADELGFSDSAHFSKFFKKSSGLNFSEFKRGHLRFPLQRDEYLFLKTASLPVQ